MVASLSYHTLTSNHLCAFSSNFSTFSSRELAVIRLSTECSVSMFNHTNNNVLHKTLFQYCTEKLCKLQRWTSFKRSALNPWGPSFSSRGSGNASVSEKRGTYNTGWKNYQQVMTCISSTRKLYVASMRLPSFHTYGLSSIYRCYC